MIKTTDTVDSVKIQNQYCPNEQTISKAIYRLNVVPIKLPMVFFTELEQKNFKSEWKAFLGGPAVKTTCQCRGHRFHPCSRKIARHGATKTTCRSCWACVLGPGSHSCWAHVLQLGAQSSCFAREATAVRGPHTTREKHLLATTRESPCAAPKTQHSQKLKKKKKLSGNTKDPE